MTPRNEEDDPFAANGAKGGRLAKIEPPPLPARDPYRPIGGYAAVEQNQQLDLSAVVRDWVRIIYKRKWMIVALTLSVVVIGLVRTLMETPLYVATSRIQIDRAPIKVVEGGQLSSDSFYDFDFLKTQYELLQSRMMAQRVATTVKLADDPDFFKSRQFSVTGWLRSYLGGTAATADALTDKANLERAAAGIVLSNRTVRPVGGSRLVDITYQDPSPARAQRIANTYGDQFIASTLDKRFEANSFAKTFLEDQVNLIKGRLEEAEKVLLEFAEREQIVVVSEKSSIAESNLSAANSALGSLASERIKNEQLWRQVEKASGINLPQILSNSVIDGLRNRRNQLVTEYQEKLETFKPGYPAMVQISNKVKEIDRQIETEVANIKAALKAGYENSRNQEKELERRIEILRTEALDLQKRSIQHSILKREVDTTRTLYNSLLQRFKEVDIAGGSGTNNVFIVDVALLPGAPSSPVMSRALILALTIGLGLSLGLAYVLERLDDRIQSPEGAERVAGLVTLGVIPKVAPGQLEAELDDPRSAVSEAYRSLSTGLQFSTDCGLPRSLLITSAGPGEGKSSTAVAIATHFARAGLKVLLIDSDLRNPSLHTKLNLDSTLGLSNYLTGSCSPPDAFQRTQLPNLAFMASGPLPPNAADLLSSPKLAGLLSVASEVFDFVVLDGPPIMGLADAALLSNAAAATVFVIGAGQAREGQVRNCLRRLQQMSRGTPVVGTIVTKFDAKTPGYGYAYGYEYQYSGTERRTSIAPG